MASLDWTHVRRVNMLALIAGGFTFAVVSFSPLLGGLLLALAAWKYPDIEDRLGLSPAYLDKFTRDERAAQDVKVRLGTQWSLGLLSVINLACGLFVPMQPLSGPWYAWLLGLGTVIVLVNAFEFIRNRWGHSAQTYEQFCTASTSISKLIALPFILIALFGAAVL